MKFQAKWIRSSESTGDVCPLFQKKWCCDREVAHAELYITALGVYEARINGQRVGQYVLSPGWTAYEKRLQYQTYDVTEMLTDGDNVIEVVVGKGWFSSPMPGFVQPEDRRKRTDRANGLLAQLHISYIDGSTEAIITDENWQWSESKIRFSEIYDGETYDALFEPEEWKAAKTFDWSKEMLIPQEGEEIREKERIAAKSVFRTPSNELVVDFGQEVTGYVEFSVDAKAGDKIRILHGEVLDKNGNFYNDNYRTARAEINYTCKDGMQTWHPSLTFFGFRYLKLVEFPGEVLAGQFTAIAVYSDIRQTGRLECSDAELNRLFSNIFWGQKGNFLDVPTDCPQRDERLGWTGDAQAFVKAASYNYDVEKFFKKWLHDLSADQREDGGVGQVIPDLLPDGAPSAAWGDASTICPWQIYLTYGNPEILEDQFASMKGWVDYITKETATPYLWTGGIHFGDWLGLDAPSGSYKGSTREDFIASVFYAYSTSLVVKAGKVLKEDVAEYEKLYEGIVRTFRQTYPEYRTQTEYVIAVQFGLAEDRQKSADMLAKMIEDDGCRMRTGFVGTPYLLHVLGNYGHSDLAYSLLLRREYPSWLYPVRKGATTVWEHWDGIMEDGNFWSADMNSFNHYAYGSVADWVYEFAAGIRPVEEAPGFAQVVICPHPDRRLEWLGAEVETRHGRVSSKWNHVDGHVKYEIEAAMPAKIIIDGKEVTVNPGQYTFWGR